MDSFLFAGRPNLVSARVPSRSVCTLLVLFIRYCFGEIVSIWDSYVYLNVFFVSVFIKVMSGRLKGIILSVSVLRFQYRLKLSFSIYSDTSANEDNSFRNHIR